MNEAEALVLVGAIASYTGVVTSTELVDMECYRCSRVHALAVAHRTDDRGDDHVAVYCPVTRAVLTRRPVGV